MYSIFRNTFLYYCLYDYILFKLYSQIFHLKLSSANNRLFIIPTEEFSISFKNVLNKYKIVFDFVNYVIPINYIIPLHKKNKIL